MSAGFDFRRPWRVLQLGLLVLVSSSVAPAVAAPAWPSLSSSNPGQSDAAKPGLLDDYFIQADTTYPDSSMPADGSGCAANKAVLQDCADLCAQTPGCAAFVYEAQGAGVYNDRVPCSGGCWLRSGAASSQAAAGMISGVLKTGSRNPLSSFDLEVNTNYPGSGIGDDAACSRAPDLHTCAQACAATPSCNSFVYGSIGPECPTGCWLKAADLQGSGFPYPGLTAGMLKTTAGPVMPQLIPPPAPPSACAGCAAGKCALDNRTSTYNCTRCQGNLLLTKAGSCSCPAGTYGTTSNTSEPGCTDCPKGSFCPGGNFTTAGTPAKNNCDAGISPTTAGLTTAGKRARTLTACVNMPGYSFSLDAAGSPVATRCLANTYSPGLKKQPLCVSCAPGYSTEGRNGTWSITSCVVPAGYYLNATETVVPCPKGQYRTKGSSDKECSKCPAGTTTANEASTTVSACSVPLR